MFGDILGAIGSVVGGLFGKDSAEDARNFNYQAQKQFAQNGVQWKVEDAKKAGVHPLYALGANTVSFAPTAVGDTTLASGIAEAGQDLGRALDQQRTPQGRLTAYQEAANRLGLEKMGLENELLASQIAKLNAAGGTPVVPSPSQAYLIDGQGPTARVGPTIEIKPLEQTAVAPGMPHMEAGAIPDMGYSRTDTGWAPHKSADVTQRLEDDTIGNLLWNVRNRLLPSVGYQHSPPPIPVPSGKMWVYNQLLQEYQLVDRDSTAAHVWSPINP